MVAVRSAELAKARRRAHSRKEVGMSRAAMYDAGKKIPAGPGRFRCAGHRGGLTVALTVQIFGQLKPRDHVRKGLRWRGRDPILQGIHQPYLRQPLAAFSGTRR